MFACAEWSIMHSCHQNKKTLVSGSLSDVWSNESTISRLIWPMIFTWKSFRSWGLCSLFGILRHLLPSAPRPPNDFRWMKITRRSADENLQPVVWRRVAILIEVTIICTGALYPHTTWLCRVIKAWRHCEGELWVCQKFPRDQWNQRRPSLPCSHCHELALSHNIVTSSHFQWQPKRYAHRSRKRTTVIYRSRETFLTGA